MILYLICLGAGLVFTVMCAVFGHFFGGHDGDLGGGHDVGGGDTGGAGISIFSPIVMATFITSFGAIGCILSSIESLQGHHFIISPIAGVGGVAIAYGIWLMFNAMFRKMQGSSESKVAHLIGCEANVITPIPAGGVGEIAYVQGGTRYSAPARTENGEAVAAGQLVHIKRVVGSQFYVEILKTSN